MSEVIDTLTLELLDWIDTHSQTYAQVLEVWRSNCPRHTTWEDACSEGLIACEVGDMRLVSLTPKGLAILRAHRHADHWRGQIFSVDSAHK